MRTVLEEGAGGSPVESEPSPVQLRVTDLHKSYGAHEVLKGVSFDVYRGKTNVIVGRSGSGKTVLLRQLLLVERPDRGRIELDGVDLCRLSEPQLLPLRRKFGMVFQDSALLDSLSVFDNVAFPLREHTKLSSAEIRSLVHGPEIVIYDEPTRGLDPVLSRQVDRLIEETRQRWGVTSLLISHDMKSVQDIAHYVNVLDDGRIVYSGTCADFFGTEHELSQAFLRASGVRRAVAAAARP